MFHSTEHHNIFFKITEVLEDGEARNLLNKEVLTERTSFISLNHIVAIHEWLDDDGAISESLFGIETTSGRHCVKGDMNEFLESMSKQRPY